jgi:hypothetical protein
MSTYGIASTGGPSPDLADDPEVLFTNFLTANWSDLISGVAEAEIAFGYEPDIRLPPNKRYIIKIEEAFTRHVGIDFPDKITQYDMIMDCHIWERDAKRIKTTSGTARFKIRRYIERFIKENPNGMHSVGIKHLYLVDAKNVPEPERVDWHHAVVTFRMLTFKVNTANTPNG